MCARMSTIALIHNTQESRSNLNVHQRMDGWMDEQNVKPHYGLLLTKKE